MSATKAEAQVKARRALVLIEQAQNDLLRAAQELSPITNGGSVAQRKVVREYDRVHALWYAVKAAAERGEGRWDLDEIARAALVGTVTP